MYFQAVDQAAIIAEKDRIIADKMARISMLEAELSQIRRMLFGQKSERFIADQNPAQMELDLGQGPTETPVVETEVVAYTREKAPRKRPTHNGRNPLPAHLPRKIVTIEPEIDTTGMVKIGEEITETLEMTEARFFVLREIRPKFLEKTLDEQGEEKTTIHIAPQPERPLPGTIAGISFLVHILMSKYADHLPLYRQSKIYGRDQVTIATSTLSDWVAAVCNLLEPLYQALKKEVLKQVYLMADESRMEVLDKAQKGKTHRGYMWVHYAPLIKLLFFDYQKGRGKQYPKETLKAYQGYLQTDGYEVYDSLFAHKEGVDLLGCMAHARRYFEKALQNDKQRASHAMALIQQLYRIEKKAREENLLSQDRQELREKEAIPVLDQLKVWALEQYPKALPKSLLGKALAYYLQREQKLRRYTQDGRLEIDNNYVENSIRPLALGRKNFLFAGSHEGAQRAAMIYSFIGSCEKCGINPSDWLKDVIKRIPAHPVNQLQELLPNYWETTEQFD